MDEHDVRKLLEALQRGEIAIEHALERLRHLPYEDLGFAKIDHHRALRQGYPEVVFARGKTPKQVAEIVRDDVAVWAAGVELGMGGRAAGGMLPGRIHLCGGGSRLPEVQQALAAERFWKRLPFARPPEVAVMAPDQITSISDATELLVDQQDVTPLGLAYQAIELHTTEDPLDATLRRVLRAMKV